MKKTSRVAAIIKILSENPNTSFSLKYFCELFGAAKSSISEDLTMAKEILKELELGFIETTVGASGGVSFIPHISDAACKGIQDELCDRLKEPDRLLAGGFLYTSDIMFDSKLMNDVAKIFARKFYSSNANCIVTIETKGIPIALMVAHLLGLPLAVVRRESKISEGSTLSINYFTGSNERLQKMSLSKRAVKPGSKAIVIDDFMRAGGSIKGLHDILREFDVEVVGSGVIISTDAPTQKKIADYVSIIQLGNIDYDKGIVEVKPNKNLFNDL